MTVDVVTRDHAAPPAAARTLADAVSAALPLLGVFLGLCALYGWEAWRHRTPWLFSDERELAALARSFAHTGHTMLRGEPWSFHSLYTIVTAPAWLLSPVGTAYAAAKYIGVFAMSLSLFPTYFLARLVTQSRWPALVAGAGAAAIPAMVYSSYLTPEAIAYPWAALCLFLIAKTLVTRSRKWAAAAALASIVAPLVKSELGVMPAVLAVAALLMLWSGERVRTWRATWSRGDWLGWLFLVAGALIVAGGIASTFSYQYQVMTLYRHGWIFWHIVHATGVLMIGVGVLPLVAGIGTLWRAPGEPPSRALLAYRSTLVAAFLLFALYTGIKGAYNQFGFATRVWERNIIYVAPLLFVALAIWLERRRVNVPATVAGLVVAAFLIAKTPYLMQFRLSSDAPGVSILAQANRSLAFTPSDAKILLFAVLVLTAVLLLAPQLRRLPVGVPAVLAAIGAVFVLTWNVTGEVAASASTTAFSNAFMDNISPTGEPTDWVDRMTHGARTVYIGQALTDPNSESLLEFWNTSVQDVWSLDGSAIVLTPGPITTPDYRQNGVLVHLGQPFFDDAYTVVEPGIDIAGTTMATHGHRAGGGVVPWRLIRATRPLRMEGMTTGLSVDGWSQEPQGSAYTRFADGKGTLRIQVSRALAGGAPSRPYHVTIRMGTIGIDAQNQPTIGRTLLVRRLTIPRFDEVKTVNVRSDRPQFRVEVRVDPPFVPADSIPGNSDRRQLGAVLSYRFVPATPHTRR